MAKKHFKSQTHSRKEKAKIKEKQKNSQKHKLKKGNKHSQPASDAMFIHSAQSWELAYQYFDNLPPTHNAFIGAQPIDTLGNVMAGIEIVKELASIDPQGLMLNKEASLGLLWLAENLKQALAFERSCRE